MQYDLFVDYYEPGHTGFATLRKDGVTIERYPAALGREVAPGSYRALAEETAAAPRRAFASGDGRLVAIVTDAAADVTLRPPGAAVCVNSDRSQLGEITHIEVRRCLFLFGAEPYRVVQ